MKSEEKIEKIARLCHEVNRIYCKAIGDFSHKSWEETPEELQNSVKAGVVNNLLKDLTPRQSHEEWVKYRSERGWVYGKEKDLEKKTHPCMVDYDDLPPEQKVKDEFFNFICKTFKEDINFSKLDFDFYVIEGNRSASIKTTAYDDFLNKRTVPIMVREGFSSALANGQKEKAICKNCIYSERKDSLVEWLCNYYPTASQTLENNFCSKGLFEIVYERSEKEVTTSDSGVRGAVAFADKVKSEKEAPPSDFGFDSYDSAKDLRKK